MIEHDLKYCPKCRDEYRQEIERCATCAIPLVWGAELSVMEKNKGGANRNRKGPLASDDHMKVRMFSFDEKLDGYALFFGAVLVASVFSGMAYFLIQDKLPPAVPSFPLWLVAGFGVLAFFIAAETRNVLFRVAILFWAIGKVFLWVSKGSEVVPSWLIGNGLFFLAGVLFVVVGRKNRFPVFIGAFLFLVGLSMFQYYAVYNWAQTLETIPVH